MESVGSFWRLMVKRVGQAHQMRVLSLDPSLRCTGYAVLEQTAKKVHSLEYGVIKNSSKLLPSSCLVAIHDMILQLILRHEPDCAAVESIIYVQSFQTAIILGSARGAAILALASRGLPIYEYAPRRVKQAVVGRGGAVKSQVSFMVRALLGLSENPPSDAADALAVGITHFQAQHGSVSGGEGIRRV